MAYPQRVVIVKSGEKDVEKRFLGYEFSNRRGNEGIHAIRKGKSIDECTQLFDVNSYDNPDKASAYVYRAFKGDYTSFITESMQSHISRISLIDMLTFDRDNFEKSISLVAKKKVKSKYPLKNVKDICIKIYAGGDKPSIFTENPTKDNDVPVYANSIENEGLVGYTNVAREQNESVTISARGTIGYTVIRRTPYVPIVRLITAIPNIDLISVEYLKIALDYVKCGNTGGVIPQLTVPYLNLIKIPVPPIDVQKQIVEEISKVDDSVSLSKQLIESSEVEIEKILSSLEYNDYVLSDVAPVVVKSIKYSDIVSETYITTDNMLQNKLGIVPFEGEANISSITEYKKEDILISNIRPYLKKIWFADKEGGCSKDVLVLRSADTGKYLPKYIFYMLRRDAFFDYVMEGKKGIKMPRGNKEDIMKYKIPMPCINEQKRIVAQIEVLELEITKARTLTENAASEKQAILDKYL